MRLLIYADLQATDGEDRSFHNPARSLQQLRVERFFVQLAQLYTEHKCDGLVDLGDTTDDRSAIPVPVIDGVIAGLEPFRAHRKTNWKIIGNHEQFLRDTSVDVGRLFDGVFQVERRRIIPLRDCLLFLASYPDDHGKLAAWLETEALRAKSERKVLFGHFQVSGATLNGGTEALLGVPRSTLERFNLTLLGHIHLPQSLGKRIHYVGSPFEQNWGEAGQPKRVAILDTQDLSVTWIPLTGFPVHRRGPLSLFLKEFDPQSEDRWKVELHSPQESQQFYSLPQAARFEAVYNYDIEEAEPERLQDGGDWSLDTSLAQWVQTVPPSGHGIELDNDEVLDVGRQMTEER